MDATLEEHYMGEKVPKVYLELETMVLKYEFAIIMFLEYL